MKTLYEISTGKALVVEAVDAKEILRHSPELYTDVAPAVAQAAPAESPKAPEDAPQKLTIAQLRETLTVRGVAFDEGAKKADLQALLDAHYTA
jgi:hypothetical protein